MFGENWGEDITGWLIIVYYRSAGWRLPPGSLPSPAQYRWSLPSGSRCCPSCPPPPPASTPSLSPLSSRRRNWWSTFTAFRVILSQRGPDSVTANGGDSAGDSGGGVGVEGVVTMVCVWYPPLMSNISQCTVKFCPDAWLDKSDKEWSGGKPVEMAD